MKRFAASLFAAAILAFPALAGDAPPAAADSPWGVAAHPLRAGAADMDRELGMMRGAGIRLVRTDFGLKKSNPAPGAENPFQARFDACDRLLERAAANGLEVVPILQGFDWEILEKYRPLYDHPEVWRVYVRAYAERYKGRIKVWEIWNEQDGGFWKPRPDAKQYVPLLRIAFEEIRKADPGAKVMLGGLCGWADDYLADLYQAGAKGLFDLVAVHPYGQGPDGSPKQAAAMARFQKILAAHGDADQKIWITECGGATHRSSLLDKQPDVAVKAIEAAIRRTGAPVPGRLRVGVPLSVQHGQTEPEETSFGWLPGAELVGMTPETLAKADPKDLPCMIGTSHLAVERAFLGPMRDYVARGGVLLAFGAVPFYAERFRQDNGTWTQKDNAAEIHPFLRIGFEAWWTKKGLPESTFNVRTVPAFEAEGIKPLSGIYVTRYLSGKNLKEGDAYTPVVDVVDAEGKAFGQAMAIYTFKDWKGAILGCTMLIESGLNEAEQANLLLRVYLSHLASGVEKLFFHNFRNDGDNPAERENNFGMVRRDFRPKPAYAAYWGMTKALGAAPAFEARLPAADGVWALRFRRAEDGKKVVAFWAVDPETEYTLEPFGAFKGTAVNFRPAQ